MGEEHPVTKKDVETDPILAGKLATFLKKAKRASPDSSVNRIYASFNNLQEFKDKVATSVSDLRLYFERDKGPVPPDFLPAPIEDDHIPLPKPPAFYAEPDYIGSHHFVGRARELEELSDWAKPADPTNLLLFEAIGGNGKSMLTWEWTTKHAPTQGSWRGKCGGRS